MGRRVLLAAADGEPGAPARRRALIAEIKGNHDAQTPEGLTRNCLLIKELNGNIAKVRRWVP